MSTSPMFYLAVGSVLSESVTTKITTSGGVYISKLLASGPDNWQKIAQLVERPELAGAIVKLTGSDFGRIYADRYRDVAERLFMSLAKVPHLILIHEAVAAAPGLELPATDADIETGDESDWEYGPWNDRAAAEYFGRVPDETREYVQGVLSRHGLTTSSYKRNSEASILATSFVDDTQSNLLFRIYVPSGKLFEDELARLLVLFHDWLGTVKHRTVRQGGYKTPRGRVIEFFGEPGSAASGINTELQEFATFLSVLEDPRAAEQMLSGMGLEPERAQAIVQKYAKEARRVSLDTKHERDRRTMAIQQQLESELVDEMPTVSAAEIEAWVQQLVPRSPFDSSSATRGVITATSSAPQVLIQQQYFNHVSGVVAQNVNGSVALGTPADDLIKLIREFGGDSADSLEAASRELSDPGAPAPARIGARQKLKDFLVRNGKRIEGAAFETLWKWLESQLGA